MKAIIFSAGLGTRLAPITNNCPKALVEVNGKPLLWHAIKNLERFGVDYIVVNVHHFAKQIIDYLKSEQFSAKIVISDESEMLLDTGGGLLKAKDNFIGGEPFLAINVDVISSVDLSLVVKFHTDNSNKATLVVRQRETSRYFLFDDQLQLSGWENISTGEQVIAKITDRCLSRFAFSGIQVISPSLLNSVTSSGKFSLTNMYLKLAGAEKIMGYKDDSDFWMDLGKPGQITIAEHYLNQKNAIKLQ